MLTLLKDCKITRVMNAVAAGTTDQESDRVDMTGFDSVIFILLMGDNADTATIGLIAKSNAADSTSGSTTEKTGTNTALTATSGDNKLVIVDLHRPTLRYAYVTVDRGTANVVIDGVIAIQYNSKAQPITQGSTVLTGDVGGPNA